MPNATDHLIQFSKLGFNYQDLALSLREIHPALSVYDTKVFDSRTTRPTDYFHFAFELWREQPDDQLKITCVSVGLIGRGPDSNEDLLVSGYYHIDHGIIPPKETVITELLNMRKRIEANEKFNMGGKPSPPSHLTPNTGKRTKR